MRLLGGRTRSTPRILACLVPRTVHPPPWRTPQNRSKRVNVPATLVDRKNSREIRVNIAAPFLRLCCTLKCLLSLSPLAAPVWCCGENHTLLAGCPTREAERSRADSGGDPPCPTATQSCSLSPVASTDSSQSWFRFPQSRAC